MSLLRRRHFIQRAGGVLAAAMCALPEVSHAAPWPSRPVRLIVVYPPGGVSDGMARVLAEPLAQSLGVPVLIENRPGAGGSLGMDALARATPDGCTLAFSAISPLTLHPLLARVPYDPQRAFVPVASVMRTPVLVVGTPAFTGHGFGELIAQARGSRARCAGPPRAWRPSATWCWRRCACRAAPTSRTSLPGRRAATQRCAERTVRGAVDQRRGAAASVHRRRALQALAVGAPARIEALPAVPTLAELGFAKANRDSLFGIFAPARTPAAVVQRLNAEINRVLDSSVVRARLRGAYNLPAGGGTDDFAHEIAVDRRRNRELVAGDRSQFD